MAAPGELLLKSDLIASYLAQADAFLHDPASYDLTLAAHIVPFLKHIGAGVGLLRRMPGAEDRARRLPTPKQQHPDGVLFELSAAIRYAREDFEVEFVPESSTRSADFRVGPAGSTKDLHVECKRLRASEYELREQDAVRADTRANGPLIVGPKMWRLLTGELLPSGPYHIMLRGQSDEQDARYIDQVDYASVLSWHCLAPRSIDARGPHIFSLLADIDRQLATAPMGTAHIGMYAERDTISADRRRQLNREAVGRFQANSKLIDIYLHYYLPRVSEAHSWTIDETAEMGSRLDEPLLEDPRIFMLAELQPDATKAAWDLPPPQPLR
jgi:hypothetical protein